MIISHCMNILEHGKSSLTKQDFTVDQRVFCTLKTGVRQRKLNSIKAAMMMIELIKGHQKEQTPEETVKWFDNFLKYSLDTFPKLMTLALVKYAIADRKLTIKNIKQSDGWNEVVKDFKPLLLNNAPETVPGYNRYSRYHDALKRNAQMIINAVDNSVEGMKEHHEAAKRKPRSKAQHGV